MIESVFATGRVSNRTSGERAIRFTLHAQSLLLRSDRYDAGVIQMDYINRQVNHSA